MDLPLKFEIPKITHNHMLWIVLPLLPGTVIFAGWVLGDSPAQHIWDAPGLGYKTKVVLAIALLYVVGIVLLALVTTLTEVVFDKVQGPQIGRPWERSYWKKVVAVFVGASAAPRSVPMEYSDVDEFVRWGTQFIGKEEQVSTAFADTQNRLDAAIAKLKDQIKSLDGDAYKARERLMQLLAQLEEKKESSSKLMASISVLGPELEWPILYFAIELMSDVEIPFEPDRLFAASLQATGACGLWIAFRCAPDRVIFLAGLSMLLGVVASYRHWSILKTRAFLIQFSASQIAFMLSKIRLDAAASHPVGHSGDDMASPTK